MQDPRGGQLLESQHEVKTLNKAKEWWVGTSQEDLPITVHKKVTSNGRMAYIVTNKENRIICRRG